MNRLGGVELTARLLHQGGSDGTWGSLGLWTPAADTDYAGACTALAAQVGQAAALAPGDRVLSVACGAGDELRLWADRFGACPVLGLERDPAQCRRAADLAVSAGATGETIRVVCGSAMATALVAGPFDAIVCVDAAYHLSPRRQWLASAFSLLRPGGRLAYTDLVHDRAAIASPLLRGAARLCGVPAADLLPLPQQLQRLRDVGFADPDALRLDEPVLGGFARFARRQERRYGHRPWQPGWQRAALTARLIPPCRAAGLGYALFWARRPTGPDTAGG